VEPKVATQRGGCETIVRQHGRDGAVDHSADLRELIDVT
jgi:hypothetical protein